MEQDMERIERYERMKRDIEWKIHYHKTELAMQKDALEVIVRMIKENENLNE